MELLFPIIIFVGGIIGGLYGSMVGSAGLLSVPLLILIGLPIHMAVATTRPAAAVLELVSAARYHQEGKLPRPLLKRGLFLGIVAAIGASIGANMIIATNEQSLRLIFSIVIFGMFLLLVSKNKWGLEERTIHSKHDVVIAITALLIGIYGGFFGFAFGTLFAIPLIAIGYTFLQGAVISRIAGAIMSSTAAAIFIANDLVNYPYAISLAAGFAIGAWVGAGIGAKKGNRFIKILMISIIMISVIKLVVDFVLAT